MHGQVFVINLGPMVKNGKCPMRRLKNQGMLCSCINTRSEIFIDFIGQIDFLCNDQSPVEHRYTSIMGKVSLTKLENFSP